MAKNDKLSCLWCKDIYSAILLNVLIAMLGGVLFFLSDAAAGELLSYSVAKGLSSVVFLYGLASAVILKKIASDRYYSK